jgi:3-oxoadipate enol-lactonase
MCLNMVETKLATRWVDGGGGIALRARSDGAGGLPLVMIHEMGGCLESWDRIAPMMTGERLVVRYDQRGHGSSEKIRDMTLDDLVADALAVAAAFEIERFVPVGCAVGGAVALALASRQPERHPAVVALSPATVVPVARKAAALARAEALIAEGVRFGLNDALCRSYPVAMRTEDARFQEVRRMRLGADPIGQAAMLRMLAGLEMQAELERIQSPALVIAGRHDRDRPPEHVAQVAALIPHAVFKTIESGHFMAIHAPDIVAHEIRDFLACLPQV